ncbi:MAG: ABC transporter permease [Chloroflexi bacterium]|nr:ABC transporter permease [Chloroflexota bacterium]NJD63640.1 ABC transporter permease [Chloroflexota bacterium]PWB47037.1 MAG: ABC transporter permease [Dehalococcoidia bacterium]
MNGTLIRLTARQLLGQKRTVLLLLFGLVPVLIAVLYRVAGNDEPQRWAASALNARLIIGTFLPLAALVFGTAALGSEFEDGTAVYILSKPIPRRVIVLSKLLVSWLATAGVVLAATVVATIIALWGEPRDGILVGFALAVVAGALVYCALFMWLSVLTSRALIVGLLYVFIWEGVITRLFAGVRFFSVRQYTLGIADTVVDVPARVFNPRLGEMEAVALATITTALTVYLAVRRLRRWEIGEAS